MPSILYNNLENRHNELANIVWGQCGSGAEPCQYEEGVKFLKYPSGVIGIYEKASPEGLIHAVFNKQGKLLSLMSGNNIVSKDGDEYKHVDTANPSARNTNAEDAMIVSIYDIVKKCSTEHAK